MIRRLTPVNAAIVIGLSLAAHYGIALAVAPGEPPVLVEGGAPAQIAALGNSFEDLTEGVEEPAPAEPSESEPVETVEAIEPSTAAPAPTPEIDEPAPEANTSEVAEALNPEPAPAPAIDVLDGDTMEMSDIAPAETEEATRPDVTSLAETPEIEVAEPEESEAPTVSAASPEVAASPELSELAPAEATDTVEARTDQPYVPRPIKRPPQPDDAENLAEAKAARIEAVAEVEARRREAERQRQAQARQRAEQKQSRQRETKQAAAPRGNANQSARTGSSSGSSNAQASAGAQRNGNANQAGNAAASNYPGKVYAKIRRTRQRGRGGRGVARVRFTVSSSGGLAGVGLAGSSGDGRVDQAALDHVRRSAPFPAPPAGAQRNFVIPIEIR